MRQSTQAALHMVQDSPRLHHQEIKQQIVMLCMGDL